MSSSLVAHWRKLKKANADGHWVHPDDQPIFNLFKEKDSHSFKLNHPPPAYVGNIEGADAILLMSNGGYNELRTKSDFSKPDAQQHFIEHLHNPCAIDPGEIAIYWQDHPSEIKAEIKKGRLAIVNACAYRSESLSEEPENQRLYHLLYSVQGDRRWLFEKIIHLAKSGKKSIHDNR